MFKLIVDTSFSWEYFKDEKGFSYVSPSCEWLTGYAPEEFRSNPRLLEEIIHPSDLESFREHLQKAPCDGEAARLKLRVIRRDGCERWVEHACRPLRGEDGGYLGLRCSVRDLTAHRDLDEDSLRIQARYETMVGLQTEAICFWQPDTTLTFVNDAYCRLTGKSRRDLLGRSWLTLIPPDVREQVRSFYENLVAEPKVAFYEHEVAGPDGRNLWMQWVDAPAFDEAGNLLEFLSIGRDITRERDAVNRLADSEERYRQLAEASQDLIFVIDRDDRIVYVNTRAAEIIGRRREELIGRSRRDVDVPVERRTRQEELLCAVFETGCAQSVEGPYVAGRDGSEGWYSVNLVPLKDAGGGVQAVLAVARDISELRDRARRLEEANIAMKVLLRHREEDRRELEEQFLANFRKLIMPSLEKLKRSGLTPRQSAYVDIIEMNARKMFSAFGAAGLAQASFTPIEMRIVEYIKEEKTTKEIGSLLNLSPRTVEYYRDRIRKKLGLTSKNVNLRSYLYTLP